MWKLVKAEFSYNKTYLCMFLIIIPIILYKIHNPDAMVNFIIGFMTFSFVNSFIIRINAEKRGKLVARLPVSLFQISLARASLVLIPFIFVFVLYFSICLNFDSLRRLDHTTMITIMGIFFSGYFVIFIMRDLFSLFSSEVNLKKAAMLLVSIGIITLTATTFLLWFTVTSKGEQIPIPWYLKIITGSFDYIYYGHGIEFIIPVCCLMFIASSFTYTLRKSY